MIESSGVLTNNNTAFSQMFERYDLNVIVYYIEGMTNFMLYR